MRLRGINVNFAHGRLCPLRIFCPPVLFLLTLTSGGLFWVSALRPPLLVVEGIITWAEASGHRWVPAAEAAESLNLVGGSAFVSSQLP